jgi:acyl-CoA synthetase (AMP-forming)/AMP-acid ligase II
VTTSVSPYGNYAHAILTANALRAPDQAALTYCGEQTLTFGELNSAVNRRAHALAAAGVVPGMRVGSLLHETLNVAEIYLAQNKLGSVLAALNPYWPEETLTAVATHSECAAFVYDAPHDDLVGRIRQNLPGVKLWLRAGPRTHEAAVGATGSGSRLASENVTDLDLLTAEAGDAEPSLGAHYDDALGLFYTSGTTGLPKAVMHTHASCLASAQLWLDLPKDRDSVFGTGSIIWGIGFPAIVGPALLAGMRLVLENDWGPANFLRVVPRERVSHVSQIPSFYASLLSGDDHAGVDLSSLKVICLGGEPVLPSLLEKIKQRLPQAGIYSYYGQTEAPYTCFGRLDDGSQDLRSSGRARTTAAAAITDPAGNRVIGQAGEINLTGPQVMKGYDKQPGKTAEVLRDGWYVGGDLGIMDADGFLTVLGRREDAIASGGQWTQPAQIEEVACSLGGVAEAGAVGVPEGAAEQKILLAVVPRAGAQLTEAALAEALAAKLPAHRRPHAIVVAGELPHTQDASGGPGKLLRREIRAMYGHLLAG